jgi:hypothetical protein
MNTSARAARHVGTTAGPAEQAFQEQVYQNGASRATANPLEQAAEVLLLLEFPLAELERVAFGCLFEERLRRAYAGGQR